MDKSSVLLGFLCFVAVAGCAFAAEEGLSPLVVTGRVFCDACGAGHLGKSSFFLSGAKVAVQCGSSQHVTAYAEGSTDENGRFHIPVAGEHEKEMCMAMLLHSAHPSCNILTSRAFANIYLSRNAGIANDMINTGPFSFRPGRVAEACVAELAAEANMGD